MNTPTITELQWSPRTPIKEGWWWYRDSDQHNASVLLVYLDKEDGMSEILVLRVDDIKPDQALEELMGLLCRVGDPSLRRIGDGWLCSLDMHVSSVGASFTVRSEFNCGTPRDAARQCAERTAETIKKFTT